MKKLVLVGSEAFAVTPSGLLLSLVSQETREAEEQDARIMRLLGSGCFILGRAASQGWSWEERKEQGYDC